MRSCNDFKKLCLLSLLPYGLELGLLSSSPSPFTSVCRRRIQAGSGGRQASPAFSGFSTVPRCVSGLLPLGALLPQLHCMSVHFLPKLLIFPELVLAAPLVLSDSASSLLSHS